VAGSAAGKGGVAAGDDGPVGKADAGGEAAGVTAGTVAGVAAVVTPGPGLVSPAVFVPPGPVPHADTINGPARANATRSRLARTTADHKTTRHHSFTARRTRTKLTISTRRRTRT
jgi:hypothetical protein